MEQGVSDNRAEVLVHLASGVGNIVLATPLLVALAETGFAVDVLMDADYPETADLLRGWSVVRAVYGAGHKGLLRGGSHRFVVPAVPPFYWPRFAHVYEGVAGLVARPPDSLFYEDEQEYYLGFARALGYPANLRPFYRLPVCPAPEEGGVTARTLVIAPGCKTGEMSAKRWPHFPRLAEEFADVAVVGRREDLARHGGAPFNFPRHARLFVDRLTLSETAALLASAGVVVGNDSGLSHVAAAVGAPTLMIFGPTPHRTLGHLPPNVCVLRAGLDCEPCWFGARFAACETRLDCLDGVTVESVAREARALLGLSRG
jgi:ADP-heptose:LPS heptosyltransferase